MLFISFTFVASLFYIALLIFTLYIIILTIRLTTVVFRQRLLNKYYTAYYATIHLLEVNNKGLGKSKEVNNKLANLLRNVLVDSLNILTKAIPFVVRCHKHNYATFNKYTLVAIATRVVLAQD